MMAVKADGRTLSGVRGAMARVLRNRRDFRARHILAIERRSGKQQPTPRCRYTTLPAARDHRKIFINDYRKL